MSLEQRHTYHKAESLDSYQTQTTMQRTLISLLLLLSSASLTHARFLSLGPRIGVHVPQHRKTPVPNITELTSLLLKDQWSRHIGAFIRFKLFAFYIQPEILLTHSSAKFHKNNKVLKFHSTQLDLPAMKKKDYRRIWPIRNVIKRK